MSRSKARSAASLGCGILCLLGISLTALAETAYNPVYLSYYLWAIKGNCTNRPHKPTLGWYGNWQPTDIPTVLAHLAMAEKYHVKALFLEVKVPGKFEDVSMQTTFLPALQQDHGSVRFALQLDWDHWAQYRKVPKPGDNWITQGKDANLDIVLDPNEPTVTGKPLLQQFVEDIQYFCTQYHKHPRYLLIDGRPVMYFWGSNKLIHDLGDFYWKAQQACQSATGLKPYFIGDYLLTAPGFPQRRATHFYDDSARNVYDAFTSPSQFLGDYGPSAMADSTERYATDLNWPCTDPSRRGQDCPAPYTRLHAFVLNGLGLSAATGKPFIAGFKSQIFRVYRDNGDCDNVTVRWNPSITRPGDVVLDGYIPLVRPMPGASRTPQQLAEAGRRAWREHFNELRRNHIDSFYGDGLNDWEGGDLEPVTGDSSYLSGDTLLKEVALFAEDKRPYGAQWIGPTGAPAAMAPRETRTISVTMKNTGNSVWSAANDYRLGSYKVDAQGNPVPDATWGPARVELAPDDRILPGQSKTFSLSITAPAQEGTYPLKWRMLQELVEWFGDASEDVVVVKKPGATGGAAGSDGGQAPDGGLLQGGTAPSGGSGGTVSGIQGPPQAGGGQVGDGQPGGAGGTFGPPTVSAAGNPSAAEEIPAQPSGGPPSASGAAMAGLNGQGLSAPCGLPGFNPSNLGPDPDGSECKNSYTRYLSSLYRDLLGRLPRPDELDSWAGLRDPTTGGPASPRQVARTFLVSPEFRARVAGSAYQVMLGRPIQDPERAYWSNLSIRDILSQVALSEEFQRDHVQLLSFFPAYYYSFLCRMPTSADYQTWTPTSDFPKNFSLLMPRMVQGILESDEYRTLSVRMIYPWLLRRPGDEAGISWYLARQKTDGWTFEDVLTWFSTSPEYLHNTQNADFCKAPAGNGS